jgi:hypothetical protein
MTKKTGSMETNWYGNLGIVQKVVQNKEEAVSRKKVGPPPAFCSCRRKPEEPVFFITR